jgi:hypothetical protein
MEFMGGIIKTVKFTDIRFAFHCSQKQLILQIMYVIIKNIPSTITIDELESYVSPTVKGGLFQKKGHIKALKIIQLIDKNEKPVERHGLVIVDSDSVKKRLINSLKPKSQMNTVFLEGTEDVTQCTVDEFFIRHWSNDRRAERSPSVSSGNMRIADRRRRGLNMVAQYEK